MSAAPAGPEAAMTIISSLTTTNWFPFGPSPIDAPNVGLGFAAGRIEAAAPHPSNPDVMYVGANNGGVWKTGVWNNDAPTWLSLGDDQRSLNFAGYHPLSVHPTQPSLVLGVVCGPGAGLLKSTNGGLGWQLLGNGIFEGAAIGSLAVHPTNTNVIYLSIWYGGPGAGVYKSTDGGQNWTATTAGINGLFTDVVIARWDAQTLFAGVVGGANPGVYKTTNGGGSWSLLSGIPHAGFSLANTGASAIRLESGSKTGMLYVAYLSLDAAMNPAIHRVRTSNGGSSWTALNATGGSLESRSWHLLLGVDPTRDKHVFANDAYSLWESTDSGSTWTRADQTPKLTIGDDWVNIAFDPKGRVVVTADRDVYRYEPKTKTWHSKEGNLQVTLFYDVTPDPSDPDVVYGVAQDHPFAMKFTGSDEWAYMEGGGSETGKVLVDPTDTSRVYVSNPLDPATFVARSTNAGQTWKVIRTANDFQAQDYNLAYSTQRSFAIDPSNPKRLLIGTTKVWQTKNATVASPTWSAISGILGGAAVAKQYITALAIAPSDPKTVYAATSDGHVSATANGGTSWQKGDTGLFGMGAGKIVDIRVHPSNPKRAVAVGNAQGSVWYLDKVGTTLQWTNIAGNLPTYLRVLTILADWQFATPALYIGTTRGVYHSVDLGMTWSTFGLDMPNTVVSDLESVIKDVLVASTTGRGAWAILTHATLVIGTVHDGLLPGHVGPGDPVEGAVIMLDPGSGARGAVLTAVTDARGRFEFPAVPPGTYTVRRTVPPGWIPAGDEVDRISVHGERLELEFRYRFDRDLALSLAPYQAVGDLVVLPGREPTAALGAVGEFERPRRVNRPRK
jgi:photosystem II stability/assembly factor-like uncharacterized protein